MKTQMIDKSNFDEKQYRADLDCAYECGRASVLSAIENIKAEIKDEAEFAYADFEQYKVDYLGVDAEYVDDELPFDDFRYGMQRALEIIYKHTSGKEQSE